MQSRDIQADFDNAVLKLEEGLTLSMPLSRPLSNVHTGLHELRLKDRRGQVRVLYFIRRGGLIFMLHAFQKKTQETPGQEIEIVLKRIKEILYAVENSHSR